MKVLRKEAISIFKELGYKTARRWDRDLIVRKLNKLPNLIEGTPDLPKDIQNNANHMCNVICRAITHEGETIELYEEGDAEMAKKKTKKTKTKKHFNSIAEYEGREAPKKSKNKSKGKVKTKTAKKVKDKTKKTKSKDKTKKVAKVKKDAAGVNKFGYRIGTMSDTVDSALSNKKHKTVAKIAEITGLKTAFVRMHLNHAVDNKRGVKYVDGKGYISTL
jgi:hypothetical protein